MQVNITTIKISSDGAWQGDDPLNFAFPLLIVQTTLVLIISRSLAFFLKPLRQPKVIAEILGGILLGPSALGRNKHFTHLLFPLWSTPILESVANIGLLFFLFLVGLELDLSSIRRSGKRAFGIAIAGISFPFVLGVGVTFLLRKAIHEEEKVGFSQYLLFIGISLSITAFPVLARILAELRLLTTRVGETAMAAAAFNDVIAWIFLALAIALAGGGHKSPISSIYILMSGIAFVAIMILIVRPAMTLVAGRCSSQEQNFSDEAYINITLAGVMLSGFMTDLIGIHAIFGSFIFGLIIPKEGEFAGRLIKRIEDFVSGLLLPLYFASSGLKTDIAKIRGVEAWGLLGVVISISCAGKVLGTFVVAKLCMIPTRESLALGVLMNTKGLVELIVLNIGKEKKVLNDETFAILVLMAIFTTFMTTPTVMAIYKPARGISSRTRRKLSDFSAISDSKDKLRVLVCVHGPENVPSLINLIELTRSTKESLLKLYVMHLLRLDERTSSIMMVKKFCKNGLPFINQLRRGEVRDRVAMAFQVYGQFGRVMVRPTTAISALSTMHEDICHVAEDKKVAMIILPFHKQWKGEGDESMENMGHGWGLVNQRVLKHAPCAVGVLVDRGFNAAMETEQTLGRPAPLAQRVCIVFFGGPDDREALELGSRMADHPAVNVTVVRFVNEVGPHSSKAMSKPSRHKSTEDSNTFSTATMNPEHERELDEAAMLEFRRKWNGVAEYTEKAASNIVERVLAVGQSRHYDLIIVGKGRFPSTMMAELADRQAAHAELGPLGDILASPGHGVVSSVLVVQQQDFDHSEENPNLEILTRTDEVAHVVTVHDASSHL